MSDTPLTPIQEILERSLFETIRIELVDKGFLPDITATVNVPVPGTPKYPDTAQGWQLWKTDLQAVATTKGYAIEIFSASSNEGKGIKKVPRITFDSGSFLPGALGGDPNRYFLDKGATYEALVTPAQTVNYYINIHLVSNTIQQARVLNALLALAIPRRGYIKFYNDPTKSFFVKYLNYYDNDNSEVGILDYVYSYEIQDMWDSEDRTVGEPVAKMQEITFNLNLQKYYDGNWGSSDTGDLVIGELLN